MSFCIGESAVGRSGSPDNDGRLNCKGVALDDITGGGDSGDLMGEAPNGSSDTCRGGIVGTGGNEVTDTGLLSDGKDGGGLLSLGIPPSEVAAPSVSLVL